MTHYHNGPEGMPKVERMSDSTLDWVANGVDTPGMYLNEAGHRQLRDIMHATAEEVLARLPNWPGTKPTHTCAGKGGKYQLLGTACAAGVLRDVLISNDFAVYRDTESGMLFVRMADDFAQRMELLP